MDMRKSGISSTADSGSYSDLNRLNQLKVGDDKNSEGNLRKVAQEFESLFLNEMLKSMRSATEALGSAQRVAALAPQAARMNKQTFRALKVPVALDDKVIIAIKNIANSAPDPYGYADSDEHREGIAAFLAKRAPLF